jgi:hypothetical protein
LCRCIKVPSSCRLLVTLTMVQKFVQNKLCRIELLVHLEIKVVLTIKDANDQKTDITVFECRHLPKWLQARKK